MARLPTDEDADLLAQLASADPAARWRASGEVFRRFFEDVRRMVLCWQGSRLGATEAKDIAQEAFERFIKQVAAKPFNARKIWGVREYLLTTARRELVCRLKDKDPGRPQKQEVDLSHLGKDATGGEERQVEEFEGDFSRLEETLRESRNEWALPPASSTAGSEVEMPASDLDRLVIAAFEALRLSERDREILRLRATGSASYQEIAALYGISAGYAKKRNFELKERLRASILSLLSRYDAAEASVIRRRLGISTDKEPSA